jgi:CRISPR/Cas system-associated exonuclease Cas4 (RecB family)
MRRDFAADVSTDSSNSRDWLSPTRVWRLTQCPASVGPVVSTSVAASADSPNAGTVAHRAVQLWIKGDGYRDADPRSRLADAISAALAGFGGESPVGWPTTRARLLSRSRELAERLVIGEYVLSEEELRDPVRTLRGVPDIVMLSPGEAAVIDLKTQTFKEESLTASIVFQLTIYAYLVELAYGVFPNQVEVFSLNRGPMPVVVTPATVTNALATVEQARKADITIANPSPETCRYCRRRMDCQPQWDAAPFWPSRDCIEGTIERIETAANGAAAILVSSPAGLQWVSGIPGELVSASVGASIRLVRLYRSGPAGDSGGFRWSPQSALALNPAAMPN